MTQVNSSTRGLGAWPAWLPGAVAVFVVLHGITHFVGTSESLSRADEGRTARYLGGAWLVSSSEQLRVLAVA